MFIKHLAVYMGSREGNNPQIAQATVALGEEMLRRGISLVYGGATGGLMGLLADTVLAGGGHVVGVIPKFIEWKERVHRGLPDLREVESMAERKMIMAEISHAAVILPGSIGTLDEMFEYATFTSLGLHMDRGFKPIGLLNANGFYSHLINHIRTMASHDFMSLEDEEMITSHENPEILISQLERLIETRTDQVAA